MDASRARQRATIAGVDFDAKGAGNEFRATSGEFNPGQTGVNNLNRQALGGGFAVARRLVDRTGVAFGLVQHTMQILAVAGGS